MIYWREYDLFYLIFFVPLLILWILFYKQCKEAKRSKGWSSIKGEIITSRRIVRWSGDTEFEYPHVIYRYQISNGEHCGTYTSSQIKIGQNLKKSYWSRIDPSGWSYLWKESRQFQIKDYPVGKQIDVYYNPNSPNKAYLMPELDSSHFHKLFISICYLLLIVFLIVANFLRDNFGPTKIGSITSLLLIGGYVILVVIIIDFWNNKYLWYDFAKILGVPTILIEKTSQESKIIAWINQNLRKIVVTKTFKHCSVCQAEVLDGEKFCFDCGRDLNSNT